MDAQSQSILTDDRVIAIAAFLITGLLTITFAISRSAVKKGTEVMMGVLQELKTGYAAVNELAIKSDKRSAIQAKSLAYLSAEQDEQKKKLDRHNELLTEHGQKFVEHNVRIKHVEDKK